MHQLTLSKTHALVCSVSITPFGHVGYLKLINGRWKFKAIGYDPHGDLIPGGGPLTNQHNTTFASLDEDDLMAKLILSTD
jgi:hypothetical protein